jgi:hypothetical protein
LDRKTKKADLYDVTLYQMPGKTESSLCPRRRAEVLDTVRKPSYFIADTYRIEEKLCPTWRA